jgi:hypothetical protein
MLALEARPLRRRVPDAHGRGIVRWPSHPWMPAPLCKYAILTLQGFRWRVVRSCRHLYRLLALP